MVAHEEHKRRGAQGGVMFTRSVGSLAGARFFERELGAEEGGPILHLVHIVRVTSCRVGGGWDGEGAFKDPFSILQFCVRETLAEIAPPFHFSLLGDRPTGGHFEAGGGVDLEAGGGERGGTMSHGRGEKLDAFPRGGQSDQQKISERAELSRQDGL